MLMRTTDMAFIYQADIYCERCGNDIRAELTREGKAPEDPDDEHTYDSGDFPKGPYGDGGGESDSPQNCASGPDCPNGTDGCGAFLENPLTSDGYKSVKSMLDGHGETLPPHAKEWAEFYGFSFHQNSYENAHEWLKERLVRLGSRLKDDSYAASTLTEMAVLMADELDGDKIQDLFQSDMDEDDYFKETGWYSNEMEND